MGCHSAYSKTQVKFCYIPILVTRWVNLHNDRPPLCVSIESIQHSIYTIEPPTRGCTWNLQSHNEFLNWCEELYGNLIISFLGTSVFYKFCILTAHVVEFKLVFLLPKLRYAAQEYNGFILIDEWDLCRWCFHNRMCAFHFSY